MKNNNMYKLEEKEVIKLFKNHVLSNGIKELKIKPDDIKSVFVHGYYNLITEQELEPFHYIDINDKFPDMIIYLENDEVIAVEAKGYKDFDSGFGQAVRYLVGSNYSILIGDSQSLNNSKSLIKTAKLIDKIGLIGVTKSGLNLFQIPKNTFPEQTVLNKVKNSLQYLNYEQDGYGKFKLNHPKNYIIIALILKENNGCLNKHQLVEKLKEIKFLSKPDKLISKMISGARELKLVRCPDKKIHDESICKITYRGMIIANHYKNIVNFRNKFPKGSRALFFNKDPIAGKLLQTCLFEMPSVRLIVNVLNELTKSQDDMINILDLIQGLINKNWVFVMGFCLTRQYINKLKDLVKSESFQDVKNEFLKNIDKLQKDDINTIFNYKLKRIMVHAGIITGKVYTTGYKIENDNWGLKGEFLN